MVGETEMNQHNGSKSGSEGSAVAQVGRLIRRILDLTELQGELFKIDAREGGKALAIPAILIATGIVLGFGGILVLLLALAEGLQRIGLSEAASFLGGLFRTDPGGGRHLVRLVFSAESGRRLRSQQDGTAKKHSVVQSHCDSSVFRTSCP